MSAKPIIKLVENNNNTKWLITLSRGNSFSFNIRILRSSIINSSSRLVPRRIISVEPDWDKHTVVEAENTVAEEENTVVEAENTVEASLFACLLTSY
uniref:Uncharacterized protein n=1 Tax=Strigamia maritima TaxID=126957 RepID=T1JMC3_STRMM